MTTERRTYVAATAVGWISDSPFPGIVEVHLRDAAGRDWIFVDKATIFDEANQLNRDAPYPVDLELACTVLEEGDTSVLISLRRPWGIESVDGVSEFSVTPERLSTRDLNVTE
jgi:hypothetical protein